MRLSSLASLLGGSRLARSRSLREGEAALPAVLDQEGAPTPRPFERALEEQAAEREARIRSSLPARATSSDVFEMYGDRRGFLPLKYAAEFMDLSEAEVVDLVNRGGLEWYDAGLGFPYVRPAIVTVLGVRAT